MNLEGKCSGIIEILCVQLRGLRKPAKNFRLNRRCFGWDSKRASHEYKSRTFRLGYVARSNGLYVINNIFIFIYLFLLYRDRLCGLVFRVPGYRSIGPGFDSQRYQIFWEVVGLERGPLSLVSTIEELLGRKNSGSGLENREYVRGDPLRWPRDTFYTQKLALTSPTSGGRSVDIVRLRTKATEFLLFLLYRTLTLPRFTIILVGSIHNRWDSLDEWSARPQAST
jgi:hypothetical protein